MAAVPLTFSNVLNVSRHGGPCDLFSSLSRTAATRVRTFSTLDVAHETEMHFDVKDKLKSYDRYI